MDADRRRVAPFMKQFNISLPVYFAAPEDAGPLTATGIPSTFLLAPDRTLVDRPVGYAPKWRTAGKRSSRSTLKSRK